MHVALIGDRRCLDDDLAQFHALVVGLLDEQVRVAQVLPEELALAEAGGFGEQVVFADSDWSLVRSYQLSRLAGTLAKLDLTLVHALSGRVWPGALRLAKRLEVPLVGTASASTDVDAAAAILRRSGNVRVAFTATTKPLADALSKRLGPKTLVQMIPPGVHLEPLSEAPAGDRALGAAITGSGWLDDDYQTLLASLPEVIRKYPDAQFFLDGQHRDQHQLWQSARRLRLLANMNLVPTRPGHHKLLLGADVLIQPQALARSHGLTLQAMAQGVPVVARQDPWLDYLIPDETARVIDGHDSAAWTQRICDVIEKPEATHALTESARAWIGRKHVAARQVALTLALYRQVSGESFKFSPS